MRTIFAKARGALHYWKRMRQMTKILTAFGKPKNSLTGGNVKFFVFPRGKEKSDISKKKTQNANACIISAVYVLPSMYFISLSLGTTKYCQ